ncbi:ABC transporter permease [Rhodopirellula bahusiensis]|uniref:ABC transporter substrate-binding protein n=2 Tax=Rhodopirellula bahusiensis TaxID=2014065 RepID=A0A2G1W6R5_9BACT|nr:ABC transporter permease [Rhodopirellula bahusiensis]PHQ34530.1 ABC transporter substrate-binding protein [Rhodopirellula bahusiensis]
MTYFGFVLKGLWRRPLRTGLTLMALATAIGSVMALLGVAEGFTESFRGVYESHRVDVVVSRQGSADRLSSSLEEAYVADVTSVEGVADAAGVLLETLSAEDQQVYGIPAMGMRTDSWLFTDYEMRVADQETIDNADAIGQVFLGENLAGRLDCEPGSTLNLFDEPFEVAGVFQSGSVWENGSMIVPLQQLQELTGRDGQITYINVVLDESIEAIQVGSVVERITAVDAKLLPLATDEFVRSDTRMQLAGAMAWMTSTIALLVGAIGTLNTMMTSVLERTGEIGILRAIGWPAKRIAGVILCESVMLALLASVLGGIGASVLLQLLAGSEATGGMLQPTIAMNVWVRGVAVGLGIGILGASLPIWRASQMRPTDALRHQG